tara:strand:- start:50 stop:433 length:384 start_codon:yes stop_codon:yes gene_type:complete
MLLIEALNILYPDHTWGVAEDSYEGIVWGDMPEEDRPSEEIVEAKRQELNVIEAWRQFREQRNTKLRATDPLVLPDYPHPSEETRTAWLEYRKKLRNSTVTANPEVDNSNNLTAEWPTPPIWPANVV